MAKAMKPVSPSGYWNVTVSRRTEKVMGVEYRPGITYRVNDVVASALGDAVLTQEPHDPPKPAIDKFASAEV